MFSLEKVKNWIIEHKKLVCVILIIIAVLIILYQFKEKSYYLQQFYGFWVPGYNPYDFDYPPMVPSETSNGFESLPQLYL